MDHIGPGLLELHAHFITTWMPANSNKMEHNVAKVDMERTLDCSGLSLIRVEQYCVLTNRAPSTSDCMPVALNTMNVGVDENMDCISGIWILGKSSELR